MKLCLRTRYSERRTYVTISHNSILKDYARGWIRKHAIIPVFPSQKIRNLQTAWKPVKIANVNPVQGGVGSVGIPALLGVILMAAFSPDVEPNPFASRSGVVSQGNLRRPANVKGGVPKLILILVPPFVGCWEVIVYS